MEWAKNDCTKNTLAYCIKAYIMTKCDRLRLNYVKQKDDRTVTNSKKLGRGKDPVDLGQDTSASLRSLC